MLEQWQPVIAAMVAACRGDNTAAGQLTPLLDQLAQTADWQALAAVFRRVLAGERDAEALLDGLDKTDTIIVTALLQALQQ
ncbi:MAG: hypothetical protein H3C34_17905 [Caldilineaceae bacterium]|nr:hypothetical protein [Caldilineaceae bacterium]